MVKRNNVLTGRLLMVEVASVDWLATAKLPPQKWPQDPFKKFDRGMVLNRINDYCMFFLLFQLMLMTPEAQKTQRWKRRTQCQKVVLIKPFPDLFHGTGN
jgi:hypothetical protein